MKKLILFVLFVFIFSFSVFGSFIDVLQPQPNDILPSGDVTITAKVKGQVEPIYYSFDFYVYNSEMTEIFHEFYSSPDFELFAHVNTSLTEGDYFVYVYDGAGMYGSDYIPFSVNNQTVEPPQNNANDNFIINHDLGGLGIVIIIALLFAGLFFTLIEGKRK